MVNKFVCDQCGRGFQKRQALNAHRTKSHPQTAPQPPAIKHCPNCGYDLALFINIYNMVNNLREGKTDGEG